MAKRFYWLKLHEDFFTQKEIKKLRQVAGGDTYVIIYLKMLLRSLRNNGRLYYEGVEENFVSELAMDIDEREDDVSITVGFLINRGILVQCTEEEYELTSAAAMTGSESDSAQRVRNFRKNKAQSNALPLQCNDDVTDGNTEKEKRKKREDLEGEGECERGNAPALPQRPTERAPYTPLPVQEFEKKRVESLLSLGRK